MGSDHSSYILISMSDDSRYRCTDLLLTEPRLLRQKCLKLSGLTPPSSVKINI